MTWMEYEERIKKKRNKCKWELVNLKGKGDLIYQGADGRIMC
jgi:hypothetical protein